MTSRLYLICGLAEAWTCAAIRASLGPGDGEDIVVLYGLPVSMPDELRKEVLGLANAFFPWTRVVDTVAATPALASTSSDEAQKAVSSLRGHVGPQEFGTIYTHTLDKAAEQTILRAFPEAEIVMFDNGLASHLEKQVYHGPLQSAKAGQVPEDLLSRVVRSYFTLQGKLPVPEYLANVHCMEIGKEDLLVAARRAMPVLPELNIAQDKTSSVLVLGTSFYRTRIITHDEERQVYVSLLKYLKQKGSPILYKEHPRANREPLITELDHVRKLDSRMPVELWPLSMKIEGVYSISSTALLTLSKLYGIPGYAIGRELALASKLGQVKLAHTFVPAPSVIVTGGSNGK